ncbi:MAG: FKBP-type peptidyl-prolyl cis-trans isomerase, partial [Polyangiaceae bacterium]|nr:FKBP-type peptidyl-prolyl cis-trans isomerase [Polyangiaceae bacterium]
MRKTLSCLALTALAACAPTPTPSSDTEGTGGARERSAAGEARPEREAPPARPEPEQVPAPSDVAAPPADAERTASGLASKVLERGTGTEKPRSFDSVTVHYTGWTTDGQMFDSSVTRGRPATFPLNRVIPGWTEGLQLMVVGETRRFWIPGNLAYDGQPGRPQGMLVFDVELKEIERMPEPQATPADV